MKSILDPTFKYVPACSTDIRKLFDRVRWELKHAEQNPPPAANVATITTKRKTA